jgi:hypothetical protein
MEKQENARAEEFLSCLGNGKGRVTDEDENPEDYIMEKQSPLSNNSNRKLRKVVPSKDKIEDNIQKQTKEQEILNKVSNKFDLELDEEVALMLIKESRTQALSEFKEKLKERLVRYKVAMKISSKDGCVDDLETYLERKDVYKIIEETAQEIK